MRAVVQRVSRAHVTTEGEVVGEIKQGLAVLLGVGEDDEEEDADYIARKVAGLRVFDDESGRMNLSVLDVEGSILLVSQFTLYGDCRKGRRPSFTSAAPPERAENLYEAVARKLSQRGVPVSTGRFQAEMQVHLVNDGPVTLLLSSSNEL
ncbi:MAG: D-aminoacyl-tRNA deacylase [Candidatus Brocadiia bacterium]